MTLRTQRWLFVFLLGLGSIAATYLVLRALQHNINLFFTPTQVFNRESPVNRRIRVGGMVKKGSVIRSHDLNVQFTVTDFVQDLVIHYSGILPDLFRENQGIVALGTLTDNQQFVADEVLAKHDENYMPPEVRDMVKP